MKQQKTFWHFHEQNVLPTEYSLLSTQLLYYPTYGFAVDNPIKRWYQTYQKNDALQCDDWDLFSDPRQTTYASYIELQNKQEIYVEEIFKTLATTSYDQKLNSNWLDLLENSIAVLRYPCHGLEMLAAYNGQMVPNSRLVIALSFQAADELRRVQHFAYRMYQLQKVRSEFGKDSKTQWEQAPCWQPLRQVIEKLLIVYSWSESFIVLNFCLKPLFEYLFMETFAKLALTQQDYLFAQILQTLNDDCQWHQQWSQVFLKILLDYNNESIILSWLLAWREQILHAIATLAESFKDCDLGISLFQEFDKNACDFYQNYLISLGFKLFPNP